MVSIFTTEITDELASLVKQIDSKVAKNRDQKMAAFVVLVTEDIEKGEADLAALAAKHKIKHTPLTIFADSVRKLEDYKIAKDSGVTVMMWVRTEVKSNHAFDKNEKLTKGSIRAVVADTAKILK